MERGEGDHDHGYRVCSTIVILHTAFVTSPLTVGSGRVLIIGLACVGTGHCVLRRGYGGGMHMAIVAFPTCFRSAFVVM